MLTAACAMLAAACSSSAPRERSPHDLDQPERPEDLFGYVTDHLYKQDPDGAVSLGLHRFDGVLPDRTPAGIEDDVQRLRGDLASLEGLRGLSEKQRFDRDVLVVEIRKRLFGLVDLDVYRTNPMSYTGAINLDAYIIRDYAPMVDRAAAVIRTCKALPAYLAQARTNLVLPLPRTFVDTALLQTKGLAELADKDVRRELGMITIPLANQAEIDPALDTCKAALVEHAAWLEKQQAGATNTFALGEGRFMKMLTDTQAVSVDLAQLRQIAEADLARNLAALDEAARAIDPKKTTREVVEAQALVRPTPKSVLEVATADTAAMRQFVVDHDLVSVPSDDVAIVRETPAFQRWNSAFLDSPGAFETKKLPSFYYISPPDPAWPEAEQLAYVPPTADLLFTTIHEVWPGHFLHKLHRVRASSRVLQSFCTYSTSEGWAHYVEEMMFDAGAGDHTPQARIGMLKEALLRNARFVATLGLHTGSMTVEQATQLFRDKGFVDAANARQQAVRGTFDPMYLAYTLGKLMIRKLREDWLAAHPGASPRAFHDEFLAHACAPVPLIRRSMLGENAGPPI